MYSHDHDLIEKDIEGYLAKHQGKELLRFVTVGSVDDGKSTLIGRLLHDTHGIYEDQLSAVKRVSAKRSTEIDFSLFTDGLKDLGKTRYNLDLKDGVNGLFRAFVGYKIRDFAFGKYKFPLVARVDAIYSPPYEFGGDLAGCGDRIKLTEVVAGLALSVE